METEKTFYVESQLFSSYDRLESVTIRHFQKKDNARQYIREIYENMFGKPLEGFHDKCDIINAYNENMQSKHIISINEVYYNDKTC